MMLIASTPGGRGFAEAIIIRYISGAIRADPEHVKSIALAMAIICRIISYYPYLIIGAPIVPGLDSKKICKSLLIKI